MESDSPLRHTKHVFRAGLLLIALVVGLVLYTDFSLVKPQPQPKPAPATGGSSGSVSSLT